MPFRYGLEAPRLNAAFVAQLLGQMMPDHEQHNSKALAIYEGAPATALFCDKHLKSERTNSAAAHSSHQRKSHAENYSAWLFIHSVPRGLGGDEVAQDVRQNAAILEIGRLRPPS